MEFSKLISGLLDKVNAWVETAVSMIPNLAVAALVIVVFALAAKWIAKAVSRGLGRFVSSPQIATLLSKLVRVGVFFGGLFAALGILHLDKTVTSLLAGVGIAGLALGFAFQDIAANFVSGILMAMRRPFVVGDLVNIADHFGRVDTIDLRATRITLLSGETVIIPNKDVFQGSIVNYTDTKCRRVELEVGVSYGDDLERAKEVAVEAVRGVKPRDETRDVEVFYSGFGSSSIDFTLMFWIDDAEQDSYLQARSQAVMAIKAAFDENGVTIPFPIRTLDFGIVGGERLRDHLKGPAAVDAAQ